VREKAEVLFDAVLYPQRSLSALGFWLLMGAVATISFTVGTVFIVLGAWPVFGFYGLDVLLVYVAFRVSFRRARAREILRLEPDEFSVRRVSPGGRVECWSFTPYWLRVSLDEPPAADSPLILSSHGKQLAIGGFLTPAERRELAMALRAALGRLKAPGAI
jgi:uncharacterized membrane protein